MVPKVNITVSRSASVGCRLRVSFPSFLCGRHSFPVRFHWLRCPIFIGHHLSHINILTESWGIKSQKKCAIMLNAHFWVLYIFLLFATAIIIHAPRLSRLWWLSPLYLWLRYRYHNSDRLVNGSLTLVILKQLLNGFRSLKSFITSFVVVWYSHI